MTNKSGNANGTQEDLQKILNEVQTIEDELPEPWNLNNSIGELERTVAAYDRLLIGQPVEPAFSSEE